MIRKVFMVYRQDSENNWYKVRQGRVSFNNYKFNEDPNVKKPGWYRIEHDNNNLWYDVNSGSRYSQNADGVWYKSRPSGRYFKKNDDWFKFRQSDNETYYKLLKNADETNENNWYKIIRHPETGIWYELHEDPNGEYYRLESDYRNPEQKTRINIRNDPNTKSWYDIKNKKQRKPKV